MMKSDTKQHILVILDQEYNIVSDESEEHLLAATALVNETMRSIMVDAPHGEQYQLTGLCMLQLASKLLHATRELDTRRQREHALVEWTEHRLSTL